MKDIFKTTIKGQLIGFFPASSWAEAAKAGASFHRKVSAEQVPWEHVTATWVNPKHYEQEGVPVELYTEPASADENTDAQPA